MRPIPTTLDDIGPEWLTATLQASGALPEGQRVVAVEQAPGAGGIAVTSCVTRLLLTLDPPGGDAPTSLFAKIPKPSHASVDDHGTEVRFYREIAARFDLAVPRCYHADIDADAKQGVLLIQDLTAVSPGHPVRGCTEDEIALILRQLAELHRATWNDERLAEQGFRRLAYDPDRMANFLRRFHASWPELKKQTDYVIPAALVERLEATEDEAFVEGRRRLSQPPFALVHGDLHTENFLIDDDADGRRTVWIFDWQDAGLKHPVSDYGNVLVANARVDVQETSSRRLLRDYHEALGPAIGAAYSFDRLLEDHRAVLDWRMLAQVLFLTMYEPANSDEVRVLDEEWRRMIAGYLASI